MKCVRLNLGCGGDYRQGYINVDGSHVVKTDRAIDLSKLPWPFPDNYADEILMRDVLEHLPDAHANLLELHRVLKPCGFVHGSVPYAKSDGAFQCPEHKTFWTEKSFDYFCEGRSGYAALGRPLFRLVRVELTSCNNTAKTRLRNLLPFRHILKWFLWNMFDAVEFELSKLP